ncbi:hypothetical protein PVAP13_7NG045334, partial [Panicum virgatum]
MKDLFSRSRSLKYVWRYSHKDGGKEGEMLGEVEGVTKNLVHWRHTIDLHERKCTCRRWQITGSMSRKMLEYDLSTPTRAMTFVSTPSPVTRRY